MNKFLYFILIFCLAGLSCQTTLKVKNGTMAYQVKQYAVAVEMLETEFERENNDDIRFQKARMLAESHDILQNLGDALKWYDITEQLRSTETTKKNLAESLKKNERYADAAALYTELYRSTREGRYAQEAEICKAASVSQSEEENTFIELFKANTTAGDYSPVYYEEDFILFTSDRESSTGKGIYEWTGQDFSDLFVMNIHTKKVHNFDALLNTPNNEGPACFTKD
ncbi:MAG: hypothetical protein KJO29_10190, partial [Bacteroidia bacterium]|nr:hypothetical protein [Bacteroidia bacterium]